LVTWESEAYLGKDGGNYGERKREFYEECYSAVLVAISNKVSPHAP